MTSTTTTRRARPTTPPATPPAVARPAALPGLAAAVRRHWSSVLVWAVAGVAIGVVLALVMPFSYLATSHLLLGDAADAGGSSSVANQGPGDLTGTAARRLFSAQVLERASALIGGGMAPGDIESAVTVTPSPDSPTVAIAAHASSPSQAERIADRLGQAYVDVTGSRQEAASSARKTSLTKHRDAVDVQLQGAIAKEAQRASAVRTQLLVSGVRQTSASLQSALDRDGLYQALRGQVASLETQVRNLNRSIDGATGNELMGSDASAVLVPAPGADGHWTDPFVRNGVFGLALGVTVGAAVAWRRADRDVLLGSTRVAVDAGVPLLGRAASGRGPRRAATQESMESLWAVVRSAARHRGLRTVLVVEPAASVRSASAGPLLAAATAAGDLVIGPAAGAGDVGSASDGERLRVVHLPDRALAEEAWAGRSGVLVVATTGAAEPQTIGRIRARAELMELPVLGLCLVDRS